MVSINVDGLMVYEVYNTKPLLYLRCSDIQGVETLETLERHRHTSDVRSINEKESMEDNYDMVITIVGYNEQIFLRFDSAKSRKLWLQVLQNVMHAHI